MAYTAFISSTNEDLRDYRVAAREAAIVAGLAVDMQEYFDAKDHPPLMECLERVNSADVVVAVIAHRYGWVPEDQPDGDRKSITWLECEAAKRSGKSVLAFLIEDNYDWPPERKEAYSLMQAGEMGESTPELTETIQDNVRRLKGFKKWLSARVCVFFSTPEDLKSKVGRALEAWAREVGPGPEGDEGKSSDKPPRRVETIIGNRFLAVGTTFRNRDQELMLLHQYLQQESVRFASVVGPPGLGKTALVSKLCEQLEIGDLRISPSNASMGADGIVYFDCQGVNKQDTELLFDEIKRFLDDQSFKEVSNYWTDGSATDADKFAFLLSKLPGHRYVVAIDNFEHALKDNRIADSSLSTFVEVCLTESHHPLRLVVTSHERVSVSERAEGWMKTIVLSGLPEDEAIAMIRDLDRDLGRLDRESLDVLKETILQCQGNPAVLRHIVGKLHDDFEMTLSQLLADEALFDVAIFVAKRYEPQTDHCKRVLDALAVYNNEVTLDAVTYLLKGCGVDAKVGICLSTLTRNFLVDPLPKRDKYKLPPSVRQYAYAQIPDDGDGYSKLKCHALAADFFSKQTTAKEHWDSIDDVQPLLDEFKHRLLANQHDNAARLLEVADEDFLQKWGYFRRVIALREQLIDRLTDFNLVASNLGNLGLVYRRTGRTLDSVNCFSQAIQMAKEGNHSWAECRWLGELANSKADLLAMDQARELYVRAIEIARAGNHLDLRARILGNLAILHRQLADFENAIKCYQEAIELDRKLVDRRWEAIHIGNLGKSYYSLGKTDKAIECYERGRSICHEIHETLSAAAVTHDIGECYVANGDLAEAQKCCQKAIDALRQIDECRLQSYALETMGFIWHCLGKRAEAHQCYEEGLNLDVPETNYRLATRMGILWLDNGDNTKAAAFLSQGEDKCRKVIDKNPRFYEARYIMGLVQTARGHAKGSSAYPQALALCPAEGVIRAALRDLELLCRIKPEPPGCGDALQLLRSAISNG